MPKDVEMCIINVYTPLSKSGRLGDLAARGVMAILVVLAGSSVLLHFASLVFTNHNGNAL